MQKILLFLSVIFSFCAYGSPWQELLHKDLQAIYEELLINSPLPLDTENLMAHEWLEEGYKQAKAKKANSFALYSAILEEYVGGFKDPHISLSPELLSSMFIWPGFVLSYENEQFVVSHVEKEFQEGKADLPALGDVVIELDQTPVKEFLEEKILKYLSKDPSVESSLIAATPLLLMQEKTSHRHPPATCLVSSQNQLKILNLSWEKISPCRKDKLLQDVIGVQQREYGLRNFFGDKGAWIQLPSFQPATKKNVNSLKNLLSNMKSLRDKEVIIFDIRGNSGGNSGWGTALLEELFGGEFVRCSLQEKEKTRYEEFRVSKQNLYYIETKMIPLVENELEKTPILLSLQNIAAAMKESLLQKKTGFLRSSSPLEIPPKSSPLFKGSLLIITDHHCASSSLLFLSQALAMPKSTHIGKATNYSTNYTEVREVDLPSTLFRFIFPMKVVRSQSDPLPRFYLPKHSFPGNISDTVDLESWIKKNYNTIIKNDL